MQHARLLPAPVSECCAVGALEGRARPAGGGLSLTRGFATSEELARLDDLTSRGEGRAPSHVAAAFSGGGDSLALLAVAAEWARARAVRLTALHVDHGLREASGVEAARAHEAAAALGAPFQLLRWTGPKPSRGIPAAARAARHELLARACSRLGAGALLLGHTFDDQAETVLMRLERTPATARGLAGLAPLSPSPAWPAGAGLAVARPLLDARRADLRARLEAAGLGWTDDPSNEDAAYERVRARKRLAALGPEIAARLVAVAERASRAEAARRRAALAALGAVRLAPLGAFVLDRRRFAASPEPARRLALEALLAAASGDPTPFARAALARLEERLAAEDEALAGATLAGAALAPLSPTEVVVARDPGAASGRGPGKGAVVADGVWDGRLRLEAPLGPGEVVRLARGLTKRLSHADRARLRSAPPAARRAAGVIVGPDAPPRLARGVFMGSQVIARKLLPDRPQAWSDVAAACAALGFRNLAHHMECSRTTDDAVDAPTRTPTILG